MVLHFYKWFRCLFKTGFFKGYSRCLHNSKYKTVGFLRQNAESKLPKFMFQSHASSSSDTAGCLRTLTFLPTKILDCNMFYGYDENKTFYFTPTTTIVAVKRKIINDTKAEFSGN